jgi:prevent-host-death family protein
MVSASEANRSFSALLRKVSQGECVTVLSRGRPVAMISPAHESRQSRLAARQALLARLKGQAAVESSTRWRRDDLYD